MWLNQMRLKFYQSWSGILMNPSLIHLQFLLIMLPRWLKSMLRLLYQEREVMNPSEGIPIAISGIKLLNDIEKCPVG